MYSSLTAEELDSRESEEMTNSDQVVIRIGVMTWNNMIMPVSDARASRFEEAVLKKMTYGDNKIIERIVSYKAPREDGKEQTLIDIVEFKRMMLKKNLLSWSLNVPIERENGWMTKGCYKVISKMAAPLLDAFIDKYEDTMIITKEEEAIIDRQASILFGKNSRGVADACEAVSMYCAVSSFNEKFGIGATELNGMEYKDYLRLRILSSKESQSNKTSGSTGKTPVTKIAGPGGRVRQSRGVVVGRD